VNRETRRQHFLPRFLLKGFASRSRRDSHFIHVFQKSRAPHETNTINVAVVGDFYGRGADSSVENGLREREREHAAVLDRIRMEGLIDENRIVLGEFVRQLLVRTRHMRDLTVDVVATLSVMMAGLLRTPQAQEHLKQEISERALRDETFWAKVRTLGLNFTEQQMKYLVDWAMTQIDVPSIAHQHAEALAMMDILGAVTAGQIGGLRRAIAERPVLPDDVVWSLIKTEPHFLILGDLAVIGRTADGYSHPMQPDAGLQAILLPIGHQHLLVGALTSMQRTLNPEEVNLASVELSRDFFLSSRNSERERQYQARLGARAQFSGLSEMLTQIAMESFRGELRSGSETRKSPLP